MRAGFGRALFYFIYGVGKEVEEGDDDDDNDDDGDDDDEGMAMIMAESSAPTCWHASRT